MLRLAALALMVVAVVAVVHGCGGDEDAAPSAKADYVARADGVCTRMGERTDALPEPALPEPGARPGDPSVEAFEREQGAYERRAEAILRDGLRELRAIPPPPGDEARLRRLYEELERAIEAVAALPSDEPGSPADDPTAAFRREAAAYGLKACAADGT